MYLFACYITLKLLYVFEVFYNKMFSRCTVGPGWVAQLEHCPVRQAVASAAPSGRTPRLRVQSPVGACKGGSLLMFLSHRCLSVSFSLPTHLSPSLSLSPYSLLLPPSFPVPLSKVIKHSLR